MQLLQVEKLLDYGPLGVAMFAGLFLTIVFLRHITKKDDDHKELTNTSVKAIGRNTEVMTELKSTIQESRNEAVMGTQVLRDLCSKVDGLKKNE